jgi:hypothetical protein
MKDQSHAIVLPKGSPSCCHDNRRASPLSTKMSNQRLQTTLNMIKLPAAPSSRDDLASCHGTTQRTTQRPINNGQHDTQLKSCRRPIG